MTQMFDAFEQSQNWPIVRETFMERPKNCLSRLPSSGLVMGKCHFIIVNAITQNGVRRSLREKLIDNDRLLLSLDAHQIEFAENKALDFPRGGFRDKNPRPVNFICPFEPASEIHAV